MNVSQILEISANHIYRFLMLTEIVANHVTICPNFCRKVLVPKEMISTSEICLYFCNDAVQKSSGNTDTVQGSRCLQYYKRLELYIIKSYYTYSTDYSYVDCLQI